MAICNKLGFPPEALQKLHVKNEMACDLLASSQILDVTITLLEGHSTVLHFLTDRILPEMVTIFFVCLQGFFPGLGNPKPMLVCPLEVFGLDLTDNGLALLIDMWHPPCEKLALPGGHLKWHGR